MKDLITKKILEWIGEDQDFEVQPDGEYHYLENQKTIAYNQALEDMKAKVPHLAESIIEKMNPIELAERIVIEYANITGREATYRVYVRQAALKVLSNLLEVKEK
jgi:hypothetical protein